MNSVHAQSLADVSKSQLIVIDVQTRLTSVMHHAESLIKNCQTLVRSARLLEIPITVTEQYPKGIGHTEPDLVNALESDYQPVEKTCFSCSGADQFNSQIEKHPQRNQYIICGIESHVCVLQTAMNLLGKENNPTSEVFIVADAVSSRKKKNRKNALSRLQQAGAIITNTESVLFEWLKNSTHEHFKEISALIK